MRALQQPKVTKRRTTVTRLLTFKLRATHQSALA